MSRSQGACVRSPGPTGCLVAGLAAMQAWLPSQPLGRGASAPRAAQEGVGETYSDLGRGDAPPGLSCAWGHPGRIAAPLPPCGGVGPHTASMVGVRNPRGPQCPAQALPPSGHAQAPSAAAPPGGSGAALPRGLAHGSTATAVRQGQAATRCYAALTACVCRAAYQSQAARGRSGVYDD